MATGTNAGFFAKKKPPAVLKHKLLEHYMPPFVGMVGSTSRGGRVVLLDGYAGEGRYSDGSLGSPALTLNTAAAMRAMGRSLECVFVEQSAKSFAQLNQVVVEYQARGVVCRAVKGRVENELPNVIRDAKDVPLFLFLDPCGLGVPFTSLTEMLNGPRAQTYPQTEILLNFSDKAVRHIGGQLAPAAKDRSGLPSLDKACGGWWRDAYASAATAADAEPGVQAVVEGYRQRLGEATGMFVRAAPVRTKPGRLPLYHLVFATRSRYGLWVFADALAHAQQAWRAAQWEEEPDDPHELGVLFGADTMLASTEEALKQQATAGIAANVRRVLDTQSTFKLVDEVDEVFGDWYGIAPETWVRDAVKQLHGEGHTSSTGVGPRVRNLVVERSTPRQQQAPA